MENLSEVSYKHLSVRPFNLFSLQRLEITKEINEHGKLLFTAVLPEEVSDSYISEASFGKAIEIVQNKDVEKILFAGIITDAKVHMEGNLYYMTIEGITNTYLMDVKIKSRSFQDNNMMYYELVDEITGEYGGSAIFKVEDEPLDEFVVQYRETDWSFIKRMASRFDAGLFPNFQSSIPQYYFGFPNLDNGARVEELRFEGINKVADYEFISSNFIEDAFSLDFVTYIVETNLQCELGEKVRYRDFSLHVQKAKIFIRNGILINRYVLSSAEGLRQPRFANELLQGISIFGNIIDIKRDMVKIHIHEIDKSQDVATAHWFQYSTMYASVDGSGWYTMPELGDHVRIAFATVEDNSSFVVSSVSNYKPPVSGPDRMGDFENRWFRNPQGMEVILTPGEIILSSNRKVMLVMKDDGTISIHADNKITLKGEEEIILTSDDTVNIRSDKNIKIQCAEVAEINMNEEGVTQILANEIFQN